MLFIKFFFLMQELPTPKISCPPFYSLASFNFLLLPFPSLPFFLSMIEIYLPFPLFRFPIQCLSVRIQKCTCLKQKMNFPLKLYSKATLNNNLVSVSQGFPAGLRVECVLRCLRGGDGGQGWGRVVCSECVLSKVLCSSLICNVIA